MSTTFWHGKQTPWETPVLIDPVNQAIYRLPVAEKNTSESATFDLPVLDAPLLVTDYAMLKKGNLI